MFGYRDEFFLIVPLEVSNDQKCDARKKEDDFVIEYLSGNIIDSIQNFMDAMKTIVTDDFEFKYRVR